MHPDVLYNFKAELQLTGTRSESGLFISMSVYTVSQKTAQL